MIAVVQRVTAGKVVVDGNVVGQIGVGMVVLVAVHTDDGLNDVQWMASKLAVLRIFRNGEKYFDLDVKQIGGSVLLISNFTVAAETSKGRRPSLSPAADPELGRQLYTLLAEKLKADGVKVEMGQFQAEMQVELTNDGPVTFIVDSRVDE